MEYILAMGHVNPAQPIAGAPRPY